MEATTENMASLALDAIDAHDLLGAILDEVDLSDNEKLKRHIDVLMRAIRAPLVSTVALQFEAVEQENASWSVDQLEEALDNDKSRLQ